jgi:hypothetical protein
MVDLCDWDQLKLFKISVLLSSQISRTHSYLEVLTSRIRPTDFPSFLADRKGKEKKGKAWK